MPVDSNEFFHEITLRICGFLEIEKGLGACFEYLSQYMPATRLYLERYDHDLHAMHIVARASKEKYERMNVPILLDENAKEKMEFMKKVWEEGNLPPVIVINDCESEPVSNSLLKSLNEPPSSALSLPLVLEDKVAGTLVLLADGKNRFNDEHVKLYSLLKEPFFVAMSNVVKHQEVLELKELLADDNKYLHSELRKKTGEDIIGANFGLQDAMNKAMQVSSLNSPVLLLGETGVGKDVIAHFIHESSPHSKGAFISVNCGAIPETLIDSELFGHEKGAFTGALSQKRGRFERADKGTIFLDEIGELPLQAQVRLLQVLQNKEIERVGGVKTIPLDVRVIAATNRDLEKMVHEGEFREDLWFRLNVFPINIPPLRDRKQDILALLQHFINLKTRELNLPNIPGITQDSVEYLMQYDWPGNVRELGNIVERAMILNPEGPLQFSRLLPVEGTTYQNQSANVSSRHLDWVITNHIQCVVSETQGKIHGPGGAAEILGINPSSLRNKMNKYGIKYGRAFGDSKLP